MEDKKIKGRMMEKVFIKVTNLNNGLSKLIDVTSKGLDYGAEVFRKYEANKNYTCKFYRI